MGKPLLTPSPPVFVALPSAALLFKKISLEIFAQTPVTPGLFEIVHEEKGTSKDVTESSFQNNQDLFMQHPEKDMESQVLSRLIRKVRSKEEKKAVVYNIPKMIQGRSWDQKRMMTRLGKRSWALTKQQNVLKTFKPLGKFLLEPFSRRAVNNLKSFLETVSIQAAVSHRERKRKAPRVKEVLEPAVVAVVGIQNVSRPKHLTEGRCDGVENIARFARVV